MESLEDRRVFAAGFAEFLDPNPAPGNQFGATVVPLSTGNVVVTSPYDDAGGTDAGAVYLFSGRTGALISVLTGSQDNDHVGEAVESYKPGVIALPNGNFLVLSSTWANGTASAAGAVTFVNGTTGLSGVVSEENSLVGSQRADIVGSGGITVLTNGNYVVSSSSWDNGDVEGAGAFTWGSGTSGVQGVVSAANSLVGTKVFDGALSQVVALTNGNYVAVSPCWDTEPIQDRGAVTWGNGLSGVRGTISSANSLIGANKLDQVGANGVTPLTNGNYVVSSPLWDNGSLQDVGAVTFGDGTTGIVGTISSANSLIGSTAADQAGTAVTPLANGNYVVSNSNWDNGSQVDAGAVTFGSGITGVSGVISATNSLVSKKEYAFLGVVTALTNGNYVVNDPVWDNGALLNVGAVTFVDGTTGVTGPVSATNSLVGDKRGDGVGYGGVTALANGNYVVNSSGWSNGTTAAVGAVTFGNGVTGITGVVSTGNSLVGSSVNDRIGSDGVTSLANGNYVVNSARWNNGETLEAGAVTLGNGTTGTTGVVSAENSLVGSQSQDSVGNYLVVPLANGNYVVRSAAWHNGDVSRAGAITFGSGTTGAVGPVSSENSLVGTTSNDLIGESKVKPLVNGDYVVISPYWSVPNKSSVGAVTFGDGVGGVRGEINSTTSFTGNTAKDMFGSNNEIGTIAGLTPLPNGNYVISSPLWNSTRIDAGAATFVSAASGRTGKVNSTNSAIGGASFTGLSSIVVDDVNRNFYATFLAEGGGRVRAGSQIEGFSRPWHLAIQPQDVNNDGQVVAQDVLAIINYINAQNPTSVSDGAAVGRPYGFLDVTGDGNVVAEDVIAVINYINAGHSGEGEATAELSSGLNEVSTPNALIAAIPSAAASVPAIAVRAEASTLENPLLLMLASDAASAKKRK